MRDDVERPTDAYLTQGRNKLLTQITKTVTEHQVNPANSTSHAFPHRSPDRSSRFGQRLRRSVLAVAAAAVLATTLVVSDVIDIPDQTPLNAEAVAVLENAAASSIHTSDPIVLPGQYLKIDAKSVYATSGVTADGVESSYEKTDTRQYYVPADPNDEWVSNIDPTTVSDSAPDIVKESVRLFPLEDPELFDRMYGVTRSPGGAAYQDDFTIFGTPTNRLEDLPRDPQKLLKTIYDHAGAEGSADGAAFESIISPLRSGIIPADLRATIYQAAALIPGVDVTDQQATLDGRIGVALGRLSADDAFRDEMIIDPATGLVIGQRTVAIEGAPGSPAGTVLAWTSVHTSVVDSAP